MTLVAKGICFVTFHREWLPWPEPQLADKSRLCPLFLRQGPSGVQTAGRRRSAGMAAGAPGQLLRDEARCPVCLDFLQEPVSVDCGHSFCLRCISEFCDKSDSAQGGLYACPQCRGPFAREGFRPNRQLASLVDGVRQLGLGAGPTGAQCARHGQELSRFCDDDQVALCWMCDTEPEHRGHRTAPLQEAARHHQVSRAPRAGGRDWKCPLTRVGSAEVLGHLPGCKANASSCSRLPTRPPRPPAQRALRSGLHALASR